MALGTTLVLGLVVAMNAAVKPPKAELKKAATEFVVEKKPPPEKQKTRRPKKTKRVKTSSAPRAPLPDLGSAVGGVDFDLPGVGGLVDIGQAADGLLADANRKTAMTAEAVDEIPRPRVRAKMAYPERARERGIEGYVTVRFKVTTGGSVSSPRVVDSKPKGVFEQVALAMIRQWEFNPGTYEGEPVDVLTNQTFRFELD